MTNNYLIKFSKYAIDLTLFTFFSVILVFLASYLYVGPQLPAVETLKDIRLQTPMSVLTEDHQLIAEFGEKRRIPVSFQEIPEKLNQALIATEDRRFYSHGGVDAFGFARSVIQLLTTGRKGGGGSTITMQLARNFFLTFDTTFIRKTKEIFLSWKIERALSKEEILTLYWNKIGFSNRAYGVGAAAQVYYGTSVDKLTLPQLAILAGIPKGPTTHNPLSNPEKAFNRRNHVLKRMQVEGYIDEQLFNESIAAPLSATYNGSRVTVRAPYLAEMVRRKMIVEFGRDKAYSQGYKVYTTLNSKLQQVSRRSLRQSLVDYDRRHGYRGVERHFDEVESLL
jgi:penicillin-binding protein 1A